MNGRMLREAGFMEMFVDPASHDAGAAVGAAQSVHATLSQASAPSRASAPARASIPPPSLRHVYLGPSIGDDASLKETLCRWDQHVSFETVGSPAAEAASLLAADKVVAWVQGRSEFGPRALGNRSILADPRQEANLDRINAVVKRREPYRPLAPAVTAEKALEYFDYPDGMPLRFMVASVQVRPAMRHRIPAVTHVDGTARPQVVEFEDNPAFWELIDRFGALTGVPVVLNTSFNNEFEPIVQTIQDALTCFLTTELDAMFVGSVVVTKRTTRDEAILDMEVHIPAPVRLVWARNLGEPQSAGGGSYSMAYRLTGGRRAPLSTRLGNALGNASFPVTVAEVIRRTGPAHAAETLAELRDLWNRRFVMLLPPAA